jgi:hypothetical protein
MVDVCKKKSRFNSAITFGVSSSKRKLFQQLGFGVCVHRTEVDPVGVARSLSLVASYSLDDVLCELWSLVNRVCMLDNSDLGYKCHPVWEKGVLGDFIFLK